MMKKVPDFGRYSEKIGEFQAQFERFYTLLVEYNGRFNLTSVTEKEEVVHKHFLDSLAGEFLLPHGAACVEIGSGAGFPSIPLKIVRRDLKLTLIESTGKKCTFLKEVVKELGLENVEVLQLRAEDAGRDAMYRERFDVCFARAVARLNTLSEYCLPLVRRGGLFVAYKGDAAEEVKEGERAISLLGGRMRESISYELPEGYGKRTLVCVEKVQGTPEKYPRGRGLERSRPLL